MASSYLSMPGDEFGPCRTACKHPDCQSTRDMAAQVCPYCKGPIAYMIPFYRLDTGLLAHALCHEEAIETLRIKDSPSQPSP